MKRWLKEPLLHFLLLGALIFVYYNWASSDEPDADQIVLSQGQQEHLITLFSRTWQRPPTNDEFSNLVDDWIREEIAYRESQQMGLDANDIIIRRRLRQKLEALAEDIVSMSEPTELELQAYLDANQEDYRAEARYSLQQVYFSLDRRGEQAMDDARAQLAAWQSSERAPGSEPVGDSLPLPARFENTRESEIAAQFGAVFVEDIGTLEVGSWQGPVRSGYGLHLVNIGSRTPGRALKLEEARQAVLRDWSSEQRSNAIDRLYERLGQRYELVIEPLKQVTGG